VREPHDFSRRPTRVTHMSWWRISPAPEARRPTRPAASIVRDVEQAGTEDLAVLVLVEGTRGRGSRAERGQEKRRCEERAEGDRDEGEGMRA